MINEIWRTKSSGSAHFYDDAGLNYLMVNGHVVAFFEDRSKIYYDVQFNGSRRVTAAFSKFIEKTSRANVIHLHWSTFKREFQETQKRIANERGN